MQHIDSRHYQTLDGLRGVAAAIVLLHHASSLYSGVTITPHGFLAVDFFFMLSGFVLSKAYWSRLQTMSVSQFFVLRLVRLMPMIILAAICGFLIIIWVDPPMLAPVNLAIATTNALVLPWPLKSDLGYGSWPLNPPTWSLFYEIWGGMLLVIAARYLQLRHIAAVCGLAAIGLIVFGIIRGNIDVGPHLRHAPIAAMRFILTFGIGMMLFHLRHRFHVKVAKIVPYVALVAVLASPVLSYPLADLLLVLISVLVVFPLIIVAAYGAEKPGAHSTIEKLAGAFSYPLYIVHWNIAIFAKVTVGHYGFATYLIVCVAASLSAAFLSLRFYDEPLRGVLGKVVKRSLPAPTINAQPLSH